MRLEAKVSEDAVVSVDLGRAKCFAIDGDDALAELAGGFGDQLLEPRAEVGDSGRGDERDFVAAEFRGGAEDQAEHRSRDSARPADRGLAGIDHFFGALEELANVEAHGGGGNHAEVGERGVAPADGWAGRRKCGGSGRVRRPIASSTRGR